MPGPSESKEPGIHKHIPWIWIPGSQPSGRGGITKVRGMTTIVWVPEFAFVYAETAERESQWEWPFKRP